MPKAPPRNAKKQPKESSKVSGKPSDSRRATTKRGAGVSSSPRPSASTQPKLIQRVAEIDDREQEIVNKESEVLDATGQVCSNVVYS